MRLIRRFIIVSVIFAAFSYLIFSAFKEVRDKTLIEFNSRQFSLAKQTSRGIECFFNYYQRELLFLSKIKSVSELDDQGKNLLSGFYASHSDQIDAVSFSDAFGKEVYSFPQGIFSVDKDSSDQYRLKEVTKRQKPLISNVITTIKGSRGIAYHVPVMSGDDYMGALSIVIPLDKIAKLFVENIRTEETGYAWMMNEDGIELFNQVSGNTGRSVREIYQKSPSVLKLIESALVNPEGTSYCTLVKDSGNREELSEIYSCYYRINLGNTFWAIIIFTPEKEVFGTLTIFRNRLFILFFLIIIVIIAYTYFSFRANSIHEEEKKKNAVENILIESEKRLRTMFELSPAGITLIDEKGTIIEVNASFCEILGYSREELLSRNIRMFYPPDKENEIERNIAEILSGKTIKHEVAIFRKDNTACTIELSETMILLPDGKTGILSVSDDVTERINSQEKMFTLSRALESIGECVSITDFDNKILFVNNAFCNTYGYSQDELIGKNIDVVRLFNNEGKLGEKILSATIQGGWNGELINIRKDGSEFPIQLSTSCIYDEERNPVAMIGIAVDITERKRVHQELISAKEKVEESDRLKTAFLTNMSHELRTPLNAIIGFSSLMIESCQDEETISNSKIILNSGQHLLSLVQDILDTSIIETGQIKINYEKTDIFSLLNEVRNIILGERIKENKSEIDVRLNLEKNITRKDIFTDSRKLKQVLINLLKNALKFTTEGYIEFGFSEIAGYNSSFLKFYVKDTGIGIDPKYHDVIFKVFRQIDDTYTRKFGGTGIGLSIAKKIVEKLGGKIWVESEKGKGSVFNFTIPVISESSEKDTKHFKGEGIPGEIFSGKTILITEDEPSNYDFLRILLTRMNIRVLWAKSGIEAVNLCEIGSSINLVFMDIKIPEMNGYEATRIIKEKRPELPVVALTAYAMMSDKEEAFKAGCDDYLSKPIQIQQLIDMIKKYL